jgi:transcriptional regulator with XRE-family HTH domain
MTKAEVGLILAEARRRSGKTQSDLAREMGTRQPAIARAEAGLRMPTLPFIERWARATGSPLSLTIGEVRPQTQSMESRRALVRSVLGPGRFNPWDRDPTPVEAQLLEKQGLTREYFELLRRTRGRPVRR